MTDRLFDIKPITSVPRGKYDLLLTYEHHLTSSGQSHMQIFTELFTSGKYD